MSEISEEEYLEKKGYFLNEVCKNILKFSEKNNISLVLAVDAYFTAILNITNETVGIEGVKYLGLTIINDVVPAIKNEEERKKINEAALRGKS